MECYANDTFLPARRLDEGFPQKGLPGISGVLLPGDLVRFEVPGKWCCQLLQGRQASRTAPACLTGVSALHGELAFISWTTTPDMEPAA